MKTPFLRTTEALAFFREFMYGPLQGKRRIYEERNIRLGSVITPSDWEVFASLLVDRKGHGGVSGVDLGGFEVKSAMNDSGYEYQYHKETGKAKLHEDMQSGHLFFNHSDFLNRVELRFVSGAKAKVHFAKWLKNYPDPYPQRYRNKIPFNWVRDHGQLLLVLNHGKPTIHSGLDIL